MDDSLVDDLGGKYELMGDHAYLDGEKQSVLPVTKVLGGYVYYSRFDTLTLPLNVEEDIALPAFGNAQGDSLRIITHVKILEDYIVFAFADPSRDARCAAIVFSFDPSGVRSVALPEEITPENLPALKSICEVKIIEEVPLYCQVNPNRQQMDKLVERFFKPFFFVRKI